MSEDGPTPTAGRVPSTLPIQPLLNTKDVCDILRIERTTLYHLELRGKIPKAMKVGQQKRWRVSDIEAFIARSFSMGQGDDR